MTKRPPTHARTYVRCGSHDCDWGVPFSGFSERQLIQLRRRFREHCIDRHGRDPNGGERICWFNLEALTLTLLDERR